MSHVLKSPVTRFARLFRRMPRLHAFSMLIFSLWLTLPAVHAAEKKSNRPVSIYCAAYAADLKAVFVKTGEDRYESISLSTANVVEAPEALVEDGRILLYGPAAADGKYPVVANAEIGEIRQPLMVMHPAAKDGDLAYDSMAVEADPAKFPLGSYSLVNLSPHPVRISHDQEVIELENASARIFTPDFSAGDSLAVTMDYKIGENWVLLSSARWAARNDRRTLVCFQLDAVSKRMNVKSVPLREMPDR